VTPERRYAIGRIATTAGILSTWTIVLGIGVAWAGYSGRAGEAYSPLNHWISELGEIPVSARASVFNLALVVGGMEFVLFMVGLAQTSSSRLRWVFGPVGAVAGLGGAFVGIYPMNHPTEHVLAATTFFLLGGVAVGVASLTFWRARDERFPGWVAWLGAASVMAFVAFIVILRVDPFSRARMASNGPIVDRPEVWVATILEWLTLAGIMTWTLVAGFTWRRTLRPKPLAKGAP
jgi:hypothetical membrane protein